MKTGGIISTKQKRKNAVRTCAIFSKSLGENNKLWFQNAVCHECLHAEWAIADPGDGRISNCRDIAIVITPWCDRNSPGRVMNILLRFLYSLFSAFWKENGKWWWCSHIAGERISNNLSKLRHKLFSLRLNKIQAIGKNLHIQQK